MEGKFDRKFQELLNPGEGKIPRSRGQAKKQMQKNVNTVLTCLILTGLGIAEKPALSE